MLACFRDVIILIGMVGPVAAGCSPYAYQKEVSGFAVGVTQLKDAYQAGIDNAAADRAAAQALAWQQQRPVLVIASGCRIASSGPCTIQERGSNAMAGETPEQAAAAAGPAFEVLQRYADALAAVTNAIDRQAFEAAQSELSTAVAGAVSKTNLGAAAGAEAGAAASLVLTAGGIWLDAKRYSALRAGVLAAGGAVSVLSNTLGRQMVRLRDVRMRELNEAAMQLDASVGPNMPQSAYGAAVGRLQPIIGTIETLRRSDPAKAAGDMAAAHAALVDAVRDDTRQIGPVLASVTTFVKAAKGVHDAFAAKPAGT